MHPLIGNRGALKYYRFGKDKKGHYCKSKGEKPTYCLGTETKARCLFFKDCEFRKAGLK